MKNIFDRFWGEPLSTKEWVWQAGRNHPGLNRRKTHAARNPPRSLPSPHLRQQSHRAPVTRRRGWRRTRSVSNSRSSRCEISTRFLRASPPPNALWNTSEVRGLTSEVFHGKSAKMILTGIRSRPLGVEFNTQRGAAARPESQWANTRRASRFAAPSYVRERHATETPNAHEECQFASSRKHQFARLSRWLTVRSRSRTTNARTGQRFPSQEVIGHARVPTLMPGRRANARPCRAPGRLHWRQKARVGGPFATPARVDPGWRSRVIVGNPPALVVEGLHARGGGTQRGPLRG